jgi:uncharacterized protein YndB with AHSA1/START domain
MAAGNASETASMNQTTLALAGDREIVIKRTFNGPARIVFEAWTNPELVKRWWAPASLGVAIVSCEADVRVGGSYRYVLAHRTGTDFAFSGAYKEVTPPSRLVYTQIFEPTAAGANPGDASILVTVTFDEQAGRTHVVSHTMCPSQEVRDGIIASGMEHGMRETMDQLETLVGALGDGMDRDA